MKLINKSLFTLLTVAFTLMLAAGCQPEVDTTANAVLTEDEALTFDAKSAASQTVWVYADGDWISETSEGWITVSPSYGSGNTQVTISVADNYNSGEMDAPRKGKVVFKGASLDRRGTLTIIQKGDTYKGVRELTVTEVIALDDEAVAKIPSSQVMAISMKGFIISDGQSNLYVSGTAPVKAGDNVYMNGARATINGYPAFILDECEVKSSGTPSYPEPKAASQSILATGAIEYVKIDGSLVGSTLRIPDLPVRVTVEDAPESLGLAAVDLHKVTMTGYYVGSASSKYYIVGATVKDNGSDDSLIPYPAKWLVRTSDINYSTATFSAEGQIEAVQGLGYISYVPFDLESSNGNQKFALDVSDNSPRITGPWPGDYWLFTGTGAIKAGSQVRIAFESRTSATGHKYWQLEYLDGTVWKVAGEVKTTSDPGEEITYTHAMNADGSTNVQVDETVKFNKNNEHCLFRFRCMANWQANGSGKLAARNGGTARLTVTDTSSPDWQPSISIIVEGDGVELPDKDPVVSIITTSSDLLTFEGAPAEAKKLTVKSDHAFSLKSDVDWISFSATEGLANESLDIMVTCQPTTLSVLREGTITITSEDSKKIVHVVQSAAGQDLDPFIGISKNKASLSYKEQVLKIKVQSNVEYQVSIDAPWVTIPQTRGIVNVEDLEIAVAANDDETNSRTAHVVFSYKEIETVLTITQDPKPAKTNEVLFEDDFSWLAGMISEYNEANPTNHIGDFVGGTYATISDRSGANAPNAYTAEPFKSKFPAALAAAGYTDLNPSAKVIYPQDTYLKFGKTSVHTGISFMPFGKVKGRTDAELSFDWVRHIQGSGTVDPVTLKVFIEGDGVFEATGTAESPDLTTEQVNNQEPFWTKVNLAIKGVTASTKITIISKEGFESLKTSGAHRYHLDNILVERTAPDVLFEDNFDWLADMISEYNEANPTNHIGDFVTGTYATISDRSGANAPNAYTAEPFKSKFPAALAAAGYTDLNPSAKVIYPQDTYLKFGKTSVHTGISFMPFGKLQEPSDVILSFDWVRHIQGSGKVDPVTLKVFIEGDGVFEDTGTVISPDLTTAQEDGQDPFWTNVSLVIKGATANTKLTIISQEGFESLKTSGAHRYHLDNIHVARQ